MKMSEQLGLQEMRVGLANVYKAQQGLGQAIHYLKAAIGAKPGRGISKRTVKNYRRVGEIVKKLESQSSQLSTLTNAWMR